MLVGGERYCYEELSTDEFHEIGQELYDHSCLDAVYARAPNRRAPAPCLGTNAARPRHTTQCLSFGDRGIGQFRSYGCGALRRGVDGGVRELTFLRGRDHAGDGQQGATEVATIDFCTGVPPCGLGRFATDERSTQNGPGSAMK